MILFILGFDLALLEDDPEYHKIIHSAIRSPLRVFCIELPNALSSSCEGGESCVIRLTGIGLHRAARSLRGCIETLQLYRYRIKLMQVNYTFDSSVSCLIQLMSMIHDWHPFR